MPRAERSIVLGFFFPKKSKPISLVLLIALAFLVTFSISMNREFFVVASSPAITLNPSSGQIGSFVAINGSGFQANSLLRVTFKGNTVPTIPSSVSTNGSGYFSVLDFEVPSEVVGSYTVTVSDASNNQGSQTFTITSPTVGLSIYLGSVGNKITISGSGYETSSSISLSYNYGSKFSVSSTSVGTFSSTFSIPASPYGANLIMANDSLGNSASTFFTVIPSLLLSPSNGAVGTLVTASGQGFDSDSAIQLSFDGSIISSVIVSDSSGSFSYSFLVPSTTISVNTIEAIDSNNRQALAYFSKTETAVSVNLIAASGSQAISTSNYFAISYVQSGIQEQQSTTSSIIEVAPDIGSTLTITGESSASNSGEIWCFAISGGNCPSVSIVVGSNGSQSITLYYYDLLSQSVAYSVVGTPLSSAQTLNYVTAPPSYGQNENITHASIVPSQYSQTIWALRGSIASTQTQVSGNYGERWAAPIGSWYINSTGILPTPIKYYQQYSQTVSYLASGASAGPTLNYALFGSKQALALPSTATTFWADAGSPVSISSQIPGSSSQERWIAKQATWTVSGSNSIPSSIVYFHQYNITLSFEEFGGGSFEAPSLSYTSFGTSANSTLQTLPVTFWIDAATAYFGNSELQAPSPSSPNSRFITPAPVNKATATGPVSSILEYYHQYLVNLSYSLVFGGSPANPSITSSVFGNLVSEKLSIKTSSALWLDSGASYAIQEALASSSQYERWVTFSSNGTIEAPSTIDLVYYHQYYLNVSTSQPSGGSVSPESGWYNATSSVTILASPRPGWELADWNGIAASGSLYTGNKSSASITLNSATQETATFYPGIVFDTTGGGSIAYTYGSHVGTIPSNSKTTLYIPVGTIVSINAEPTFFVYKFDGWQGPSSQLASTKVVAGTPLTFLAHFTPGSCALAGATAVAGAVGSVAFIFYWSGFNFVPEDIVVYGGELWIVSSQRRKSGKKSYDLRRPFGTVSSSSS